MYEKILVALDGSLSSLNALRESFKIKNAAIVVVCVAPPYEGDLEFLDLGLVTTDLESLLREPCDKALAEAGKMAKKEDISIETVCEIAKPHEGIVNVAEAKGCDLIIMGRRGFGLIERTLMGSVTARVIGFSPVDVLVVPEGGTLGWNEILLATDGSDYSKNATVRAMALTKAHGGNLKVVSATDIALESHAEAPGVSDKLCAWPRYCVMDVVEQAAKMGVHPECMVREGKAYKAILNVAEEVKADVIVVGSHGRTGLKRLLMGSVTERVIGHSTCPVLVVRR